MTGQKLNAARVAAVKAQYGYGGGGQPVIPDMGQFLDDVVVSLEDPGRKSVGLVNFAAQGDCTSVTVGTVTYTRGTQDNPKGIWGAGANQGASATNLAAAINGDQRNAGGPYYAAIVSTATVFIFALAVGAAGNVAVARVGGAQPATVENLVGGADAAVKQTVVVSHTVTTEEGTLVEAHIPLPFAPSSWTWVVRDANGGEKAVTDRATVQTGPNRIKVATNGATHIAATDVIVVVAVE